jgi:hypothetical protein
MLRAGRDRRLGQNLSSLVGGEAVMAIAVTESALKAFEQIEDPNAAKAQRQLSRLQREYTAGEVADNARDS